MCKFAARLTASALLLVSLPALSQTRRQIDIDVSKVTGPHSATPLMTVGAGRANEGLRADWQQQLATVQSEIGFHYIRFHGLLHDDMGVYTQDDHGTPSYNFQYIDTLYDALLAQHIRPFVELSFMPAKLARGTKTVFWWKANVSPPKDMEKWNGLIRALMTHWRERYGEQEISSWYYEVWNDAQHRGLRRARRIKARHHQRWSLRPAGRAARKRHRPDHAEARIVESYCTTSRTTCTLSVTVSGIACAGVSTAGVMFPAASS